MAEEIRQQMMKNLFGTDESDGADEVMSPIEESTQQSVTHSKQEDEVERGGEEGSKSNKKDTKGKGKKIAISIEEYKSRRLLSSKSSKEKNDLPRVPYSPIKIQDVFGDSDEDGQQYYATPSDTVNNAKLKGKKSDDKLFGPPLELEVPLRPPPAQPDKMKLLKVSNIFGIEPKPFDRETYVDEEDVGAMTDESGSKKRIQLKNNIVRWREVKNPDGTITRESNARFARWSDGSLQLLIGKEALDVTEQDAEHLQAHLFLQQGKGILQSQGRLLNKMSITPSSLASNSHRSLTALVGSQNKKTPKVKSCTTNVDPEWVKEEKAKIEAQAIRANEVLQKKRAKVNRKHKKKNKNNKGRQLSPGFLEDSPNEDDEPDYFDPRHTSSLYSHEEDLAKEKEAEKRIINAKRSQVEKDMPRKSSLPSNVLARPVDSKSDGDKHKMSSLPKKTEESEQGEKDYERIKEEIVGNKESQEKAKDDEPDYFDPPHTSYLHSHEEDLAKEKEAEKRIINAKRSQVEKDMPRKSSLPSNVLARPVDSKSDGDKHKTSSLPKKTEESEQEGEKDYERNKEEIVGNKESQEKAKEPRQRTKNSGRKVKGKRIVSDDDSPPKQATTPRRKTLIYESDED